MYLMYLIKLIILIPFCNLLYKLFIYKEIFTDEIYFYGFYILSIFGIVGILFNINLNLGIFYLILSFGLYSIFYDLNIYNLWAIGCLLLLIKVPEKRSEPVLNLNRSEEIKKVSKGSEKSKEGLKKVSKKSKEEDSELDSIWGRYIEKHKESILKIKYIKIKEIIKKIWNPYGL